MKTASRFTLAAALMLSLAACSEDGTEPIDTQDTGNGDTGDTGRTPDTDPDTTDPDVIEDECEGIPDADATCNRVYMDRVVSCLLELSDAPAADADALEGQCGTAADERDYLQAVIHAPAAEGAPWVYVDFGSLSVLPLTDDAALGNGDWDLAFRGDQIRVNSARSGSGAWYAIPIEGADFDTVEAPDRGESDEEFLQDTFVDADTCAVAQHEDGRPVLALDAWADRSGATVAPDESTVFVFYNLNGHGLYRFSVDAWSEDSFTVRWGGLSTLGVVDCDNLPDVPLIPAECTEASAVEVAVQTVGDSAVSPDVEVTVSCVAEDVQEFYVDAHRPEHWVYLDLDAGVQLPLSDAEAVENTDWDLAIRRTEIRMNSGDSGPGKWLVHMMTGTDFESAEAPSSTGVSWLADDFVDSDTCEVIGGLRPGSFVTAFGTGWYDYSSAPAFEISPKEGVVFALYRVEAPHGRVYRLAIDHIENNSQYTFRIGNLTPAADISCTPVP